MIDGRLIGPRDIDKLPGEQLTFIDTKNLYLYFLQLTGTV